jgi:cytochrome c biogenesis protein CcdA
VLNGLAVAAALTALLAGLTGAFSPCGFSVVDTIGGALGDVRRWVTLLASLTFSLGALIGGALTFVGLGLAGSLLGDRGSGVAETAGAAIALLGAVLDWRGVKIAPQIRRQVPERWRWVMPLPLAAALYGLLLGLGFTTFVLSFAVWALAGVSFAVGSLPFSLAVGLAFGLGRALPVVWMAPGLRREGGTRQLDAMGAEPRLWLGLRRLDAIGLLLCAFWMGAGVADAFVLPAATNPVVAGRAVVWQKVDGTGMLRRSSGKVRTLPGTEPALGGSRVAWRDGDQVTVADEGSLQPTLRLAIEGVNALAVSSGWLVYRDRTGENSESLIGLRLAKPSWRRHLFGPRPVGQIGRPALDGSRVVFAVDTPRRSKIEAANLGDGGRHTLRRSERGAGLFNPALLHGRLLYERVTACAQQLRLGSVHSSHGEHIIKTLASTIRRDPGYEIGYEHAWNMGSKCPNRGFGGGGTRELGPVALGGSRVYLTEAVPGTRRARVITLSR